MRIYYKGDLPNVKIAVEDANELLSSDVFYQLIAKSSPFQCTNLSTSIISSIIKDSGLEVEILLYKPQWRFSSVLGYFTPQYPNNIFLNARKIFRDSDSISNTIIHEYVHAIDNAYDRSIINFGHDCKYETGTAPYVIGQLAEDIINKGVELNAESLLDAEITILPNRIL